MLDKLSSNMYIAKHMFETQFNEQMYFGLEDGEIYGQFPADTLWFEDFSPIKRHWYRTSKDSEKVNFIEPYEDFTTGDLAITMTKRITKGAGGQFMGVAAID